MKNIYLLAFSFFFISSSLELFAQNTVGLLSYNPSKSFDGYNLIYPHNQPNTYLINNCGEIINTWEGEPDTRPGNTAYLLNDGRLVRTSRPAAIAGNPIWAGGGGANIEIRDWDNTLLWQYTVNDSLRRFHHDIAINESNGKLSIFAIVWELKNLDEVIAAGRDTSILESGELWPDYIIEIDPETDQVVWEWHVWDHLIQDFDSTAQNYGVVADHPELVDVNLDRDGNGRADWMHSNSLDYDPVNDLLILSVPTFNEIWIIDASTSTAEAASHFGGFSGRGGDLMYRWGNPAAYKSGTAEDQKLFFQHDVNVIDNFIPPFDPMFGKISIFNNRAGGNYSTINVLNPGFDMYMFSFPFNGTTFEPSDFELSRIHPIDTFKMFSGGMSSVQYLPNSNFLICVGRPGYAFEMTEDHEIVWEYKTPLKSGIAVPQGDSLSTGDNPTFRMQRIPADYTAFEGKDLSPKGYLELIPDKEFCANILETEHIFENLNLEVFPNPANEMITVKWDAGKYIDIDVYDMQGRKIFSSNRVTGGKKYISTASWTNGMFVIQINGKSAGKFMIFH